MLYNSHTIMNDIVAVKTVLSGSVVELRCNIGTAVRQTYHSPGARTKTQ